jgi:hypothetical protein
MPIIPPGERMYDPASGSTYYRDELYSSPSFGDYDNDGDLDLFVTQVYYLVHGDSHLFRNNGNLTFTNVTEDAGVKVWNSWGTAWADYDNDGDLDLIVEGSSYPNPFYEIRLYRNNGSPNNWLKIDLRGCWSNWAAIGARVTVTNGSVTQMREVEGGTGTGSSQNSLTLEFGFDNYSGPVDIQIRWPSGLVQDVNGVTLNQTLEITEISCLATPTGVSAELDGTTNQNVRVMWTPSPDEGSGYFSNYAVYRGTTYNKYGSGYIPIGDTPAGTTELIDLGMGHGDPNTYFYYVQVNSTTGFGAKSKAQAAKYAKYLEIGMNLISSPVLSSDSSFSSVLRTLDWDKAWSYDSWDMIDHWKSSVIGKPFNDFATVAPSTGIWVNVRTADYFTVAGGVPVEVKISLSTGWNLVGYPSFRSDYTIADLTGDTQCVEMEGYSLPAAPYHLMRLQPTDIMMAGSAYWVRVPADIVWTVEN